MEQPICFKIILQRREYNSLQLLFEAFLKMFKINLFFVTACG